MCQHRVSPGPTRPLWPCRCPSSSTGAGDGDGGVGDYVAGLSAAGPPPPDGPRATVAIYNWMSTCTGSSAIRPGLSEKRRNNVGTNELCVRVN